jgi:hypothetical protein
MNKLLTTDIGGLPITLNDIRWNDDAYREALTSVLLAFGNNFIVQGCAVDGDNIAAGYIMLNGELLKVDAHAKASEGFFEKITTLDPSGVKEYKLGQTVSVRQKNRATATADAGNLKFDGLRWLGILPVIGAAPEGEGWRAGSPVFTNDAGQLVCLTDEQARAILALGNAATANFGGDGSAAAIARTDHKYHDFLDIPNYAWSSYPPAPNVTTNDRIFSMGANTIKYFWDIKSSGWLMRPIGFQEGACPFLYFQSAGRLEFYSEVIKNQNNIDLDKEDSLLISKRYVEKGKIVIVLKEEKDEISFIDYLKLQVNGTDVMPDNNPFTGKYYPLRKGEVLEVIFTMPIDVADIKLITKGYYQPLNTPKFVL